MKIYGNLCLNVESVKRSTCWLEWIYKSRVRKLEWINFMHNDFFVFSTTLFFFILCRHSVRTQFAKCLNLNIFALSWIHFYFFQSVNYLRMVMTIFIAPYHNLSVKFAFIFFKPLFYLMICWFSLQIDYLEIIILYCYLQQSNNFVPLE